MKIRKNYDELTLNNKCSSLIINNKKKKSFSKNINNSTSNNNNILLYNNTVENHPIESYKHSNFTFKINKPKKMIYFKNKLRKNLLFNHKLNNNINIDTQYLIRSNTLDYNDEINPINKGVYETQYTNYIYDKNTLRKNRTGLNINKNLFDKIKMDSGKAKRHTKSLKNLKLINKNYKKNLFTENKLANSLQFIKNNTNNKIIKIKNTINKKIDEIDENEEDLLNSNNNDAKNSKELFNLLVKKLNLSIEENEKDQKIIKKLKEENNKLKQKIISEKKKNEIILNKKEKELFEIKKSRDVLKNENKKLKADILKLIITIKESYNNRNKNKEFSKLKDDIQLNQLDSICSSIGGLSAFCNNFEKE